MAGSIGFVRAADKKQVKRKVRRDTAKLKKRASQRVYGNTKRARNARKRLAKR